MSIGSESADLATYLALLPLLSLLLNVQKFGKKKMAGSVALGLLTLIGAVKLAWDVNNKEQSLYDVLQVQPTANFVDIKKGFKRLSVEFHPDKLQQQHSDDEVVDDSAFLALKHAYDVLSDSQKRDLYNKFGPRGLENEHNTTQLIADLGFFYVVWIALSYTLTRSKPYARAQTWTFTGLLALGIFEYQSRIAGTDFLEDLLKPFTIFEKIELLHRIVPIYILASRIMSWMVYEDLETYSAHVLQRLHAKTDILLLMIRDNYYAAKNERDPEIMPISADTTTGGLPWGQDDALQAAFRPLHPAMAGKSAEAAAADAKERAALRKAAVEGKRGKGLSGLVWFFGVYFFFQWLLGRGQ